MRLQISPELSAFVADRIANYTAEATEPYHHWEAPDVAAYAALPLVRHWFETIALTPDGEIVKWSTDDPPAFTGALPVTERYHWLTARVDGARRYPELAPMLPVRPSGARTCRCVGQPLFAPGKMFCPECCALGWLE